MEFKINNVVIALKKGDITAQKADAIVNAANPGLMGGGGVDGAIHRAGGVAILNECKEIVSRQGNLPPGKAVITTAGDLAAKYVIHTVGPIWYGGNNNEEAILVSAYTESLKLAEKYGLETVAFPSISTGAYGYPVQPAARAAITAVARFAAENASSLKEIIFVLFSEDVYKSYTEALGKEIQERSAEK
ncbi:MAG: O-acetyl-ADP-ribose deacetylase [Dehalococcoidales bacterium]